jgi:hypothetical protein
MEEGVPALSSLSSTYPTSSLLMDRRKTPSGIANKN